MQVWSKYANMSNCEVSKYAAQSAGYSFHAEFVNSVSKFHKGDDAIGELWQTLEQKRVFTSWGCVGYCKHLLLRRKNGPPPGGDVAEMDNSRPKLSVGRPDLTRNRCVG